MRSPLVRIGIAVGALALVAAVVFMVWRAESKTNKVATIDELNEAVAAGWVGKE